jgi:hypothetical protein
MYKILGYLVSSEEEKTEIMILLSGITVLLITKEAIRSLTDELKVFYDNDYDLFNIMQILQIKSVIEEMPVFFSKFRQLTCIYETA